MPIKHGVPLIDWLRGLGTTRASVDQEGLEFDQRVKMTADLNSAPGSPFGVPMRWAAQVFEPAVGISAPLVMFEAPAGGAVIDFIVPQVANSVTEIEWANFLDTGAYPTSEFAENIGGRQWDLPADPGTVLADDPRGTTPLGTVIVHSKVSAAVRSAGVSAARTHSAMICHSGSACDSKNFPPTWKGAPPAWTASALRNRRLLSGRPGTTKRETTSKFIRDCASDQNTRPSSSSCSGCSLSGVPLCTWHVAHGDIPGPWPPRGAMKIGSTRARYCSKLKPCWPEDDTGATANMDAATAIGATKCRAVIESPPCGSAWAPGPP